MLGIGVVGMARARRVERLRASLRLKVIGVLIMAIGSFTKDGLRTSGLGADVNRYHVELVFVWCPTHGMVVPVSRTVSVGSGSGLTTTLPSDRIQLVGVCFSLTGWPMRIP